MDRQTIISVLKCHAKDEWAGFKITGAGEAPKEAVKMSENAIKMEELKKKCGGCKKCGLYATAANLVFSDGSPDASLAFVGEAPGADEDAQGLPFVGRAGKLLTATLEGLGVPRRDVYICNILKHRPPDNRNPAPDEIAACTPFLVEQLSILKPKVIITLGNFSTKFLLNTEEGITRLRGNIRKSPMGHDVLPTYHPAAVLRNPNNLDDFKNDIAAGLKYIGAGR